jgi:ribosomal silencing factor RsfS
VKEFESIRILLSHLNFGSIDSIAQRDNLTEIYSFESNDSLVNDIKALDLMSTRIFCNCFIFYVKANQSDIKSILNNFVRLI